MTQNHPATAISITTILKIIIIMLKIIMPKITMVMIMDKITMIMITDTITILMIKFIMKMMMGRRWFVLVIVSSASTSRSASCSPTLPSHK